MRCPFCKKEIGNAISFCPDCGQKLVKSTQSIKIENYWNRVNKADLQRNAQYKDLVNRTTKEKRSQINKFIVTFVFVVVIVLVIVFGRMKYNDYSTRMVVKVQTQLIGKTLTSHSTHMEGLGWMIHEYRQLTFIDENTLSYAYISTTGPRDEDEVPKYKGTYNYTISRTVMGNYQISTDGTIYELNVSDNNDVRGISQK